MCVPALAMISQTRLPACEAKADQHICVHARTRAYDASLSLTCVLDPPPSSYFVSVLCSDPVKATANVCQNCDGRGVIVCQNCEGTGIQPRFLERYSPDDFMD